MEENIENNNFFKTKQIIKGIFMSIAMSMILLFLLSIILCYSDVSEKIINPTIIFISIFSILISSFCMVKKIKKSGIIYGSLLGIIYMFSIYFISSFISMDFRIGWNSIAMIILGIISGAIGGIIGVNLQK